METQVELSFLDASTGTVLAARGLVLAMALGVAARRRAPLVAAAVVFAALTGLEQLGDQANTSLVGPFASAFIVSYSIGANLEGRGLAVGVGWLVALVTAMAALDPTSGDALNLIWGWLVIVAAPVLAGRLLRDRARLARALRDAPAGADLTAYRVVQEALAGAMREGGAAGAAVTVRYAADAVELEVVDDGSARAAPLGIAERVALYGGELSTASPRGGGQALRARLPFRSAA